LRRAVIANIYNGYGGGVRVTLSIAKALLEAGWHVDLVGLSGLPLSKLEEVHGVGLQQYVDGGKLRIRYRFSELPITAKARLFTIKAFENHLIEYLNDVGIENVSLVVFFDDVPLRVLELLEEHSVPIVLYIHFSYVHRIALALYDDIFKGWFSSKFEVFKERLMRAALREIFAWIPDYRNVNVLANSTITRIATRIVWKLDPQVLYPLVYIPSHICNKVIRRDIAEGKENFIVTLGAFEPSKRHDFVLEVFSRSRIAQNAKLFLVGSPSHDGYLRYLYRKIKELNIKDRVKMMVNANEETKWYSLSKAKVIVHPKIFEPFGIAVLEGMYAGAIPIVYKGLLSGPWIDIVKRGRYGFGFRDLEELSDRIEQAIDGYDRHAQEMHVMERAKHFEYENFKGKFINIVKSMM